MEREPFRTEFLTSETWQAANHCRVSDIAALLVKWRPNFRSSIMPARRRLAIPTAFASLVVAAAVWTVAGTPTHHTKTFQQAKQTDRPAFDQTAR
jgi:hypothetical protein